MHRVPSRPCPFCLVLALCLWLVPRALPEDPKTDLDADMNRDGIIDDDDPTDNGSVQDTPPGLPLCVGALEMLALRCTPARLAQGYVRLTVVSGLNEWKYLREPDRPARPRRPAGGHIRVWEDTAKTKLVLDTTSGDARSMTKVWELSRDFPMGRVPSTLYAEGVAVSPCEGGVSLVLEYGPTEATLGPGSTRDILVATVRAPTVAVGLDADLNRDGTIEPGNPADTGEAEDNPPGLPLAVGTLEKLAVHGTPADLTRGYVRLTVVSGPNEWQNLRQPDRPARPRRPAGGHIRVWEDPEKTKLVLDTTSDARFMTRVWALSDELPMARVPATLYAEGVEASPGEGGVSLVLDYGPTEMTLGPGSARDILVITVRAPPP